MSLAGIGLVVAGWSAGGDALAWVPGLSEARFWLYNLRYPPLTPSQLGDGGPAEQIVLVDPMGLAADRAGNVYVSDRGRPGRGRVIWKIDGAGRAHIIAGTGRRGSAPGDVSARRSDLGSPEGLALDGAGRLYFADAYNHVVLRLDPDGRLARVAGSGRRGVEGDGGPALHAELDSPYDVAFDASGNLYIADYGNHRIRRVSPAGVIVTVAGTGAPGYSGDGGPARAARLNGPYGVLVDRQDRLTIADSENHVIRRVERDGTIETIAGTGQRGYAGDGGLARSALLDTPQALAVDGAGRLLIGDEHNHAVRRLAADGTIATLVGTGSPGEAPSGAPAAHAPLRDPEGILAQDDGSLLITEGDNRRIIMITLAGRIAVFAGAIAAATTTP